MKAKRLVFTRRQTVALEEFDPGEPGDDEVLVSTRYSLMSTGTENIVFNRLFAPDTHWDRWVKYPFYPGYTSVGVVAEAGSGVASLRRGDRVAFRIGHRSHHVAKASECYPIPDAVPFPEAAWFSLAKIAFHGARAARYTLGDSVLVIGAGPIGQMSIRWAHAAGLRSILVVDSVPDRMPLARAGGATEAIVSPVGRAREAVLAGNHGRLPRGPAPHGRRHHARPHDRRGPRCPRHPGMEQRDHSEAVLRAGGGRPLSPRRAEHAFLRAGAVRRGLRNGQPRPREDHGHRV